MNKENLGELFAGLFTFMKSIDYRWEPQSPKETLKLRNSAHLFDPIVQYFGLGIGELPYDILQPCLNDHWLQGLQLLRPAISRCGSYLVSHHHWTDQKFKKSNYIYYGQETLLFLNQLQFRFDRFIGMRVLDLGSGSGALSLEVASLAEVVLGLEISGMAVQWSNASAQANGLRNVQFLQGDITSIWATEQVTGRKWDRVLMNPPLILSPGLERTVYKDGGHLGIELPLRFLKFASEVLVENGEVFCLVTNPVVQGRSMFFDQINTDVWKIVERKCLNTHYNHELYREEAYVKLRIQRIELWFVHLKLVLT